MVTKVPQIKQSSKGNIHDGRKNSEDYEFWLRLQKPIKPDDQLDLTETELNVELMRQLETENPNYPKNLVVYSFKNFGYVPLPQPSNTTVLLKVEGSLLHIESEKGKKQLEERGTEIPNPEKEAETVENSDVVLNSPNAVDAVTGAEVDNIEPADEDEVTVRVIQPELRIGKKKKLINQFNYCERAVLTTNNPSRTVETQTIPPPRSTFGSYVLQWIIYDSYIQDFKQSEREKEKDRKANNILGTGQITKKVLDKNGTLKKNKSNEELNKKYLQCWQILERMINQNIYDEIALDYRYYEDPSDEYREEDGTLLPLWRFHYEKTSKMSVTDMCFNTLYHDLFAVCYGSFDFLKQPPEGSVCLFTIKNPSYPDFIIMTESGVMCCDIHPKYPFLLLIGMLDGNVAVYNLQTNLNQPIYKSRGIHGKHSNVVWEVKWGLDMQDGEINFYSVSADGTVYNWILMQSRLSLTPIITLYLDQQFTSGPDGNIIELKAAGTCMVFHPKQSNIFLIGTEEGLLIKCSSEFSSRYLMTYNKAHYLPIHRIDYNKYNSNIFASCGGDWRVKIWEDMRSEPLFIFDLGASVSDMKWAPYSSTVLAALTNDGKVFVFDIDVNKYKPICIQQVVSKRSVRLTRIAFNKKIPIIIVGDDKGTVTTLKLSPNLRLKVKPPKKMQHIDQSTLQIQKLDRLLSLVRELPQETESFEKEAISSLSDA